MYDNSFIRINVMPTRNVCTTPNVRQGDPPLHYSVSISITVLHFDDEDYPIVCCLLMA